MPTATPSTTTVELEALVELAAFGQLLRTLAGLGYPQPYTLGGAPLSDFVRGESGAMLLEERLDEMTGKEWDAIFCRLEAGDPLFAQESAMLDLRVARMFARLAGAGDYCGRMAAMLVERAEETLGERAAGVGRGA